MKVSESKLQSTMKGLPVLVLLLFSLPYLAEGQKKVKMKQADNLVGSLRDGVNRFVGNVVMVQNRTTIYCDSAIFHKSQNLVYAYGHVRITEGDSVTITGDRLVYRGDERRAVITQNVVFTKLNTATLYTDQLEFDRGRNLARYFSGGKLVDSTNTLISQKGYFNTITNMASFKTEVEGTHPDYVMRSDSLQYHTVTKVVYFRTLTHITDTDGNTFTYDGGEYDTKSKRSSFVKGQAETPSYWITGRQMALDDIRKVYRARGDVVMTSKEENLTVYGDEAVYNKALGFSKVYGRTLVAKVTDEQDTLFLTADTLVSIESEDPARKRLLAYHHVRIYKSDLQGIADSVVYFGLDSLLVMYRSPALWSEDNQMTSDTIQVVMMNNTIDRIYLRPNAFVISQDSLRNFNQIKGRKMTAYLGERKIDRVLVEGNGESLYFALEEDKDSREALLKGMNRITCSDMTINFLHGQVNNITFYVRPDASFIPPHELESDQKRLKGFIWLARSRPDRAQVVGPINLRVRTSRPE
jgi:lipopolysaccharide export system protein LptA